MFPPLGPFKFICFFYYLLHILCVCNQETAMEENFGGWDVVVVGSGVGGMATALACAIEGLSVGILEKSSVLGGTTAWSGGVAWLPVNDQIAALGLQDTRQAALDYILGITGNRGNRALIEAFVDNSAQALRYFETHSHVAFSARPVSPDYRAEIPGAAMGGRALDPVPFDESALGDSVRLLRDPLPMFTFAGAMVTAATLRNLMKAGRSLTAAWGVARMATRATALRMLGRPAGPRTLGNALAARLYASLLDRKVPILLNQKVEGLIDKDGEIRGVRTSTADGEEKIFTAGRAVVLATGGFPRELARRGNLIPGPNGDWSMSPPENTGDGIRLAEGLCAKIGDHQGRNAHFAPVSLHRSKDERETRFPHLLLDRAKPGLIAVNRKGRRFVNEAENYHDFVLGMLKPTDDGEASVPAYLICDRNFLWRYGLGMVGPFGVKKRRLERDGYLISAPDLRSLANILKIDEGGLVNTVNRVNSFCASGRDQDFGKGESPYNRYMGDPEIQPNPCLGPIVAPPFYAVQIWPGDLGTSAGLVTNERGQVLRDDGRPISGLFAAGNDMNSVTAGAYPGSGGTIGPALTFAMITAQTIARDKSQGEQANDH